MIEGQRLAALLRQAVRQHYGLELPTAPAAATVTTPKAPSDPASHS